VVYRSSEAESLSLKYYSFGMDVIIGIGEMRFVGNKTIGEIHTELSKRISISERSVQYLIETYMLLVTGVKQDKDYLDEVISPEGIILSIDGIQPEKGNEVYPSGCAFRGSARLIFQIGTDCRDRIKSLAYSKLKVLKGQLQSVGSRYSKIYQVRHHRPEFLKGLVDRWKAITAPATVPI